jgi:hypothetical protein
MHTRKSQADLTAIANQLIGISLKIGKWKPSIKKGKTRVVGSNGRQINRERLAASSVLAAVNSWSIILIVNFFLFFVFTFTWSGPSGLIVKCMTLKVALSGFDRQRNSAAFTAN